MLEHLTLGSISHDPHQKHSTDIKCLSVARARCLGSFVQVDKKGKRHDGPRMTVESTDFDFAMDPYMARSLSLNLPVERQASFAPSGLNFSRTVWRLDRSHGTGLIHLP